MVLLQNRKYKPDEITSLFIDESKILVRSIVEACAEGELSYFEASDIITQEVTYANLYNNELSDMLWKVYDEDEMFEVFNYIDKLGEEASSKIQKDIKLGTFNREEIRDPGTYYPEHDQSDIETVAITLKNLESYWVFLKSALEKLWKIGHSVEYPKNRKEKVKLKLIKDGLVSFVKNESPILNQNSDEIIDFHLNRLIKIFPKFSLDYKHLMEYGYFDITDYGLKWLKSKQSLAEYFQSIKPDDMKKISWSTIQYHFGEKNLKNSASSNGNPFHKPSKDFEKWKKIKTP